MKFARGIFKKDNESLNVKELCLKCSIFDPVLMQSVTFKLFLYKAYVVNTPSNPLRL